MAPLRQGLYDLCLCAHPCLPLCNSVFVAILVCMLGCPASHLCIRHLRAPCDLLSVYYYFWLCVTTDSSRSQHGKARPSPNCKQQSQSQKERLSTSSKERQTTSNQDNTHARGSQSKALVTTYQISNQRKRCLHNNLAPTYCSKVNQLVKIRCICGWAGQAVLDSHVASLHKEPSYFPL